VGTAIDAVLERVGSRFFQQAYVVTDLQAAQHAFTSFAGCERWTTFPVMGLPYRYRGRDIESSFALAFGRSGRVQVELIQPIDGEGLTHEFLADHGPGAHHIAFLVDSVDEEVAFATKQALDVAMSGHVGTLYFAYLDTFAELGIYLEVVEDPDGLIPQLTP
jgi:catechol 2,3-dioxygenase-like lactoylglutathione lyase family enzyme